MKFNKLIPELSVTDINVSKDFYVKLGFKVMYERDKFYFLELDGNQIMIEEINDNWSTGKLERPFGRGINISMSIDNIDEFYEKISKEFDIFMELKISSYNVDGVEYLDKEFLIQDPDGYLLRFNS